MLGVVCGDDERGVGVAAANLDALAFGAATIGIAMAKSTPLIGSWMAIMLFGGTSLSGATVTRMYFLHVFILPVIVTGLIIIHLFIVWVQGIAEPH
ncbi:MAG: cytochrome b N-terminal domain-containing protein [Candidatus Thalassarchaeaceae archaeon]|nr:cytochrome b N-terminal domain-containing protein [Candidatus Thalassarchaeaceae archaeon]